MQRDALRVLEAEAAGASSAGDLHLEIGTRDTPPALALWQRDVVHRSRMLDLDPLVGGHFGGDVEIHNIAFVVAIDIEDSPPSVDRLGRFEDVLRRRCGEYIPACRRVCK